MNKIKTKFKNKEFVIGCNKKGVIEFNKSLYKELQFTEEQIEKLLERDFNELLEGYYSIDKNGVTYHGKTN